MSWSNSQDNEKKDNSTIAPTRGLQAILVQKTKRVKEDCEWDSGNSRTYTNRESQEDLYERLNEALTKQIKFVDRKEVNVLGTDDSEDGIYLFRDSRQRISSKDLLEYDSKLNQMHTKQKKPNLGKRRLEDEVESDDESTKLKSVAVSFDWVINGEN